MNQLININQNLTMSSREIAELTGKEHSNVLADVRTQFAELYDIEKDDCNFNDKLKQHLSIEFDNRGYMSVVNLDREQTYTLIAGYSVKLRNVIIKRWQELENQQPKPKQLTNRELALMVTQEADRADKAEATVKRLIFNDTYLITNNGFIVSMPKKWAVGCNGGNKSHNGKVLSQVLVNGYLKVRIKYPDGERKTVSVHRLIAQAFIPNPENKPQVNHINGIKTDNRVENLEWVTAKENNTHAILNELTHVKKGKNSNAKPVINTLGEIYECARDADDSLNYKYGTVSKSIRRGNLCGGVKWAFIPAEWTAKGREFVLNFCEGL